MEEQHLGGANYTTDLQKESNCDELEPYKLDKLDSSKKDTWDIFAKLTSKVKSTNFAVYDFRNNYDRTYVYKKFMAK